MLALEDIQLVAIVAFVLTLVAVIGVGSAVILVRTGTRRKAVERLSEEPPDSLDAHAEPKAGLLLGLVSKIGLAAKSSNISPALKSQLANAGYYRQNAATVFIGAKIVLLIVGLALLPVLLICAGWPLYLKILAPLSVATLLFMIPNFLLSSKQKARGAEIRRYLPNAIDLLDVSVSAGVGLSAAWNMVADEMAHISQSFAEEMALTNLEEHLGVPRAAAMKNLANRTGVEEIATLSAVLVQSEKFGTDIAMALRTFATSMRQDRSAKSEEIAEKTAVRLLFPMVIFILPAMFIVVAGPAGMTLAKMMSGR